MPLLLRRAAPSPSVDELSFQTSATSLTATMSASDLTALKCPLHGTSFARSSSSGGGRRRSLNSSETENSSSEERDSREEDLATTAAAAAAEVDAERASGSSSAKGSFCCTCPAAGSTRTRASQGSSKRISTRLDDFAATVVEDPSTDADNADLDTDDNESCCSHDADATCHKCDTLSARESISSNTSSRVVIRDTQLAALDVEIQNLRKTFVRSMYARLSTMSRRLGKRDNATPQIAMS